ncbi:hypothetical protein QR680_013116 [Steinernema hermaphroditum]|uniref:Haloacid dehalogenase-like hydrolase domain-containing protein 3 n=1 Tax=Steinernema hermaphroditum TaxID=289476 RepID=A0AA39I4E8_9BILA|nr:hypothetical protein QR680_013116 [Steinernema hermaphroditum]
MNPWPYPPDAVSSTMLLRGVRVVSLDAMNTIIGLREAPSVVYARIAGECGLEATPETIDERFPKAFRDLEHRKPCYDLAGAGPRRWWAEVVAESLQFAPDAKDPRLQSAQTLLFDYYAAPEAWRLLDDEVAEHLRGLRCRDVRVVVVSNFDYRLRRLLSDLGVSELLDDLFLSGEIGLQKPDPRLFRHALDAMHLQSPNALLHVGDHQQKDLEAPRTLGMRTLLLEKTAPPPSASQTLFVRSIGDLLGE